MNIDPEPTATVEIAADPGVIFDHLVDPRTYPDWLVGAQDIRAVDGDWPAPGARFHHRVGVGPLHIEDTTTVVSSDRPTELVLLASIGPLGRACVRFELVPQDGSTRLILRESPEAGLVKLLGRTVGHLAMRVGIWGRNQTSLSNLQQLIASGTPSSG